MSLLALLAAKATPPVTPAPGDSTPPPSLPQTVDYPIPTTAPYNVDTFITEMTDPYGHGGSIVHPDVLDFGAEGWRGHRYWMVATPYYGKAFREENPSVWYGDRPTAWTEAGTNPVIPPPENTSRWNSDTDLVHDAATDQLAMVYRDGSFYQMLTRSSDGATWGAPVRINATPGVAGEVVSPVLHRVGSKWALWGIQHPTRIMYRWTADTLEGEWSAPVTCTGWNTDIWHFNIVAQGSRLLCLMHEGWTTGTAYAATSTDGGVTWVKNPTPVLATKAARSGKWDSGEIYRSAISLHENGTHMRCWYPGYGTGSDSWRLAYTEIPLTEWPS